MEFIHILMAVHIKDNGQTVNSMERAFLLHHKEHKEKEYGKKERGSNGSTRMKLQVQEINNMRNSDSFNFSNRLIFNN